MRYTQKWGRPLLQTNHKFNELHPALGSPPPHSRGYKIWQTAADTTVSGTPLHLFVPQHHPEFEGSKLGM